MLNDENTLTNAQDIDYQYGDMHTEHYFKPAMENMELAQAYIPFQKWKALYPPEEGLVEGTIFPELNRPYHGTKKCKCKPIFKI